MAAQLAAIPDAVRSGRFRKRPVVVDAVRFTGGGFDCPSWLSVAFQDGQIWYQGGVTPFCTIATLEGDMRVSMGDWIIKGVQGEIYPCKPDIFAATYEVA